LEKDKYPMTKLSYVKIKGKEDATTTAIPQTDNFSNLFG